MAPSVDTLTGAKAALVDLIKETCAGPILIRLAWHDAGTYDAAIGSEKWPACGGANGSIRFDPEINHGANAGLNTSLVLLEPIKEKFPDLGYADLLQLASATAIELMGGPVVPMRYGRADATGPEMCHPEGNLPAAAAPFPSGGDAAGHLRAVFHRMGLTDEDIVVLSGAHTVGRAHASRSGACHKSETKYTCPAAVPAGTKTMGGASWCCAWTAFDNEYFKRLLDPSDEDLLVLETDKVLVEDEKFRPFVEKFAADQDAFFEAYKVSHKKLSELGVKWDGEPVEI